MRYEEVKQKLLNAVLNAPGDTKGTLRRAALQRAKQPDQPGHADLPASVGAYVDKVARHAYKVTDEDLAALQRAGHSDDALFEVTVAAALGAALHRLERGMAAVRGERSR
jgi:hypothetical protein